MPYAWHANRLRIYRRLISYDFFSTNIELEQPEYENQLTISSIVLNDQENLPFYVGRNSGLFDNLNDAEYRIDNALVTITRARDGISFNSDDIYS